MLNKGTTGTKSFVWHGLWLGIEPAGTSCTRSQHSTTRLLRRRSYGIWFSACKLMIFFHGCFTAVMVLVKYTIANMFCSWYWTWNWQSSDFGEISIGHIKLSRMNKNRHTSKQSNASKTASEMVKDAKLLPVRNNILFFTYCGILHIYTGPICFTSHGLRTSVFCIDCYVQLCVVVFTFTFFKHYKMRNCKSQSYNLMFMTLDLHDTIYSRQGHCL